MNKEFTLRLDKIETALSKALSMDFSKEWQENAFGSLPQAVSKEYIQKLIEPNQNLIQSGGKRWRPLFLMLCHEMALKSTTAQKQNALSEQQTYSLTPLVEFVHTASLIHDDIEDSADLRRGKPAAHITYGLDTALNAASWLYFVAPMCINRLSASPEIKNKFYALYTNELRRLHLGQAMDIYWHRNPDIFPSQAEYQAMVKCKTGTLSSLAAQVGFLAGGEPEEVCTRYGEIAANIGIAFQIIDDVINLTTGNPGKKRGDDIVEGKKSLIVIQHVEKKPEDKAKLSELFKQASKQGIDSPAVEQAVEILSDQTKDSLQSAKDLLEKNLQEFASAPLIQELFYSMLPKL